MKSALNVNGKRVGELAVDSLGGVTLTLQAGVVTAEQREAFLETVRIFLKGV